MSPSKIYDLSTTNLKRTKAILQTPNSTTPTYSLDLSFALKDLTHKPNTHSIVMRALNSNQTLGTCDITFSSISHPIHLGFGDLSSCPETVRWEDMLCTEKWRTNGFELRLEIGGVQRCFVWKRTRSIEGMGFVTRNSTMLHLKMVEKDKGSVVARFVHNPLWGSRRGRFEIEEEGGAEWEVVVMLSGLAVLEYLRKAMGLSW